MDDLPLNALRAFAAIYETGGVRAAARQLSSSPSSVHRHLRELEKRVGTLLVEPDAGIVRLTTTGEHLARAAQEALATLRISVDAAREDRRANDVVVSTSESFARRWLLPRLASLRQAHPRILVSLRVGRALAQLPRDADLAIRIGAGPWPGEIAEPLMDESIVPVLSPAIALALPAAENGDPFIDALLAQPLIHDRDAQASWRRWASAQGIDSQMLRGGARLPSSDLVLEAARLGLGVAMARLRLAADDLKNGNLVGFNTLAVPIGSSYWLVRQPKLRVAEQIVIDWLREEARR